MADKLGGIRVSRDEIGGKENYIREGAELVNKSVGNNSDGRKILSDNVNPDLGVIILDDAAKRAEAEIKRAEAEDLVTRDSLTGLANEKGIIRGVSRLLQEAVRDSSKALLVIKADIRYFKAYDDLFTWEEGNNCLKQLTTMIQGDEGKQGVVRADSVVGRLGGDDFIIAELVDSEDISEINYSNLTKRLLKVGSNLHTERGIIDAKKYEGMVHTKPKAVRHALRINDNEPDISWNNIGMMTLNIGTIVVTNNEILKFVGDGLNINNFDQEKRIWDQQINPRVDNASQTAKEIDTVLSRAAILDSNGNTIQRLTAER